MSEPAQTGGGVRVGGAFRATCSALGGSGCAGTRIATGACVRPPIPAYGWAVAVIGWRVWPPPRPHSKVSFSKAWAGGESVVPLPLLLPERTVWAAWPLVAPPPCCACAAPSRSAPAWPLRLPVNSNRASIICVGVLSVFFGEELPPPAFARCRRF